MSKHIELSETQRRKLEKIWFVYGNNGKKHTHRNHRFIQNFLESGEDTEKFYRNADTRVDKLKTPKMSEALTDECVNAVRQILSEP